MIEIPESHLITLKCTSAGGSTTFNSQLCETMGLSSEIPEPVVSQPEESGGDQKKHIASIHPWDILKWHIWGILSLSGTVVLLWLNLSHRAIGAELGSSAHQSADIIGTLQLIIKVHELLIVASLANIAHQLLIGSLLKDGIILGLLGAESALADPSFLVSAEYQHALRIGFRGAFGFGKSRNPGIDRKVFGLALFILWASVLSCLAGPASAVLMIPRVDWNYFDKRTYSPPLSENMFPNVMISTWDSEWDLWDGHPDLFLGLEYWDYYFRNSAWNETNLDDLNHDFGDVGSTAYINTTGLYGRQLRDKWDGGTAVTCMMQAGFQEIQDNTWGVMGMDKIGKGWRGLKSTVNINALNASVTCRNRDKIPCNATAVLSGNSSDLDWCYMSVDRIYSGPDTLRRGQDLLLAADYENITDTSRVWITEGPRSAENQHYSESIEVVFEGMPSSGDPYIVFDLTVCSFSGALVSAIGTTPGARDTPPKIELFDYVLHPNGSQAKPRRLLFHENWLDYAHTVEFTLSDGLLESPMASPFSFPQRPRTSAPRNNLLGMFGNNTRRAGSRLNALGNQTEALSIEVVVGGALTYLLAWIPTAVSQYSMEYNDIPQRFTEGIGGEESWLTEYIVRVYREGYVFKLSTRTGYLGCVVLILHAATVIVASLWQLFRMPGRGVFLGWKNTPEYTMLGANSAKLVEAYPNTGVGIEGKAVLRGVIVLEKRVDGTGLEIVAKKYDDMGRTEGTGRTGDTGHTTMPLSTDDETDKY